jgi:hypothetical protein
MDTAPQPTEYEWPDEDQCLWCREPFRPRDRLANGTVMTPAGPRHQHLECAIRSVVGGVNHLRGHCSCCGGDQPPDPEGVPTRVAAHMAYNVWRARNP